MFQSLWRPSVRAVLLVSERAEGSLFRGDFLRQPQIRLLTALPGEDALDLARRERPCLIIEEIEDPGHSGLAFCRDLELDSTTRAIPLILIAPASLGPQVQVSGADVVLVQPLDRRALFDAVRRFISLPHRRAKRAIINLRFTFEVQGRTVQAFSRDLSEHGAFLKTDRTLPLGTRIDLRFRMPGVDEEVRCRGVVRCTSAMTHSSEPAGIGVEFEELGETESERLLSFVALHAPQRAPMFR